MRGERGKGGTKSRRNDTRLKEETRNKEGSVLATCGTTVDVSLVPRLFSPSFPSLLQMIKKVVESL